jgi:hypothetical protein
MSRTITALGQHTLPFDNRKEFIKEIAHRFEANVYIGFYDGHDNVMDELPTFKSLGLKNPLDDSLYDNIFLIDKHLYNEGAPIFILMEDDYEYRWMLEKFGEQAGYQEKFIKHWTNDPIENNNIIKGFVEESRLIYLNAEGIYGRISMESASVGLDEYFTDWINFFYLITRTEHKYTTDFYESLLHYRNTNRNTILKLGGSCIYYYDDQGKITGGAVQGNEWDMTWEEIENSFNSEEPKKYQLNLCEALTNPKYLKEIQEKTKDNFHDYSVFYDDFRELKWEDIIKNE